LKSLGLTCFIATCPLRCPQNPLSFYNTSALLKVRFASKTDFNQHTPQPLKINFGCPLPRQNTCASRSTGQRFIRASLMRPHQHLQKHFVGNTTGRATDAVPVKPSFLAQLGMCQPACVLGAACGAIRTFTHQPARRSHAPHPSKFTCANSPPPARSQHRETRRRFFSRKRTLTIASAAGRAVQNHR